nr:deleted in malignant brain tumors 1 protein-like [Paramormyrops kingsleyae]
MTRNHSGGQHCHFVQHIMIPKAPVLLSSPGMSLSTGTAGDVRLVNAESPCAGRVEVFHEGQWGTVCHHWWDTEDAAVVCRQMFCGEVVLAKGYGQFGEGTGKIWMEDVACKGSESTLKDCGHNGWGRNDCGHHQDAGAICSGKFEMQLKGENHPCSGRLEFQHLSSWYTVCDPDFDLQDAKVVCRQLGCGIPVEEPRVAAFGKGGGQVWSKKINCTGDESDFRQCLRSSTEEQNCTHKTDVGLKCFWYTNSRLVGGPDSCSGRVELQYLRTGPIWLDEVDCEGNETSLWDCPSAPRGQNDCAHKEDVGVVCSEHKEIRLAEGCSGQLEVFYNGTWGNVCFNQMETNTASLICQHLNCGESGTIFSTKSRLKGALNWLDNLKCRPHDSTLWQCPSSNWGDNKCGEGEVAQITCEGCSAVQWNCSHKEDAGVTCAGSSLHKATTGIPAASTTTKKVPPSVVPSQKGMSIPFVVSLVLGALLFLLLVITAVQLYQNRVLKRAVYCGLTPLQKDIYEEIEYNLTWGETFRAPREGRVLSEELPSGYEDVEDSEGDPLSGSGLMVTGDTTENYDDVEGIEQSPHVLPGVRALATLPPGDGPPEPDQTDYDDVGEEGLTVLPEEAPVQRFMKMFFK